MFKILSLLALLICAHMRRKHPGPPWTAGAGTSFVLLILLVLAPSGTDAFVRVYDRVYHVSGAELGRLTAALNPAGPIAVVMEHDARVNQERLEGLRRELRRHGLHIQEVFVIPTPPEQPGFPFGAFEEKIKSRGFGAVISFYGLPRISDPDANEWPPMLGYFPYGESGAAPWIGAGILRGGLAPKPDFAPFDMKKASDQELLWNHYQLIGRGEPR